nr:DUF6516 family protein [Candidatus Sigynarchaeota archaeon]
MRDGEGNEMGAIEKIERARDLLLPALIHEITSVQLSDEHFMLRLDFGQHSILYIRYNDYQEYSYQILVSHQVSKSIRYDNFDDRWEVSSRPNHVHLANKTVASSPMNGDPVHDMPLLIKTLQAETGV